MLAPVPVLLVQVRVVVLEARKPVLLLLVEVPAQALMLLWARTFGLCWVLAPPLLILVLVQVPVLALALMVLLGELVLAVRLTGRGSAVGSGLTRRMSPSGTSTVSSLPRWKRGKIASVVQIT